MDKHGSRRHEHPAIPEHPSDPGSAVRNTTGPLVLSARLVDILCCPLLPPPPRVGRQVRGRVTRASAPPPRCPRAAGARAPGERPSSRTGSAWRRPPPRSAPTASSSSPPCHLAGGKPSATPRTSCEDSRAFAPPFDCVCVCPRQRVLRRFQSLRRCRYPTTRASRRLRLRSYSCPRRT